MTEQQKQTPKMIGERMARHDFRANMEKFYSRIEEMRAEMARREDAAEEGDDDKVMVAAFPALDVLVLAGDINHLSQQFDLMTELSELMLAHIKAVYKTITLVEKGMPPRLAIDTIKQIIEQGSAQSEVIARTGQALADAHLNTCPIHDCVHQRDQNDSEPKAEAVPEGCPVH